MGFYIEPADGSSKEEWLKENAILIPRKEAEVFFHDHTQTDGTALLCAIENGRFTAVGYIYDAEELQRALGSEHDLRPKFFFLCDYDKVWDNCPSLQDARPKFKP